jgi:hypothetical protein
MDSTGFDTWTRRRFGVGGAATAALLGLAGLQAADAKKKKHKNKKKKKKKNDKPPTPDATGQLVRSTAAQGANCIANATGNIELFKLDGAEKMVVNVSGLPANTEFDVFVIQAPDATFGMSWYQGDLETDGSGKGTQEFIGRFNIETFIVAPGVLPAPQIHTDPPFPDAINNPATDPVHTFHVGLWFNSPADAAAAGCPNTETPFNGDHTAGIQALKTVEVGGLGPLAQLGS